MCYRLCEFGACGAGPSAATPGQNGQTPAIAVLPYSTYQNILSMRASFDAAVANMNSKGRLEMPSFLRGGVGGAISNMWQCPRSIAGRQMYGCGEQASEVYGNLDELHLNSRWTFNFICRWALSPHQYITATLPGGPSTLIDPWKNIFQVN